MHSRGLTVPHHCRLLDSCHGDFRIAIPELISSSMCTGLEKMLPRYVNLSTIFSFCPFTVMVGSLYGFQELVGIQPLSFCAHCEIIVITCL